MVLPTDTKPLPDPGGGSWKLAAFLILALTILGSIPTVVHIFYWTTLGVSWGEVPFARQQQALWQRNWMCATGPGEQARLSARGNDATAARRIETFTGLRLRVQACPNGDVLARTVTPDGTGRAVWIASEGFEIEEASLAGVMSALAQEIRSSPRARVSDADFSVMCQAWGEGRSDSGRVVRIISLPGDCIREEIDILTGKVVSAETVPCNAECASASE
jgi:hypothetical protein